MGKLGDIYSYNDYELLYLSSINIDEAREIIFNKYEKMIKARIREYKIPQNLWDDYFQEGIILLNKTIKIYDENSKMTFTNFFDLILRRKIITLLRKDITRFKKISFEEDFDLIKDNEDISKNYLIFYEEDAKDRYELSDLEANVYHMYFKELKECSQISEELSVEPRIIYNAKSRVIKKITRKLKIKKTSNSLY